MTENTLTHYGLVTPYTDTDLAQYWHGKWLVAWLHRAITWTNVDFSLVMPCDIHLTAISLRVSNLQLKKIGLEIMR